MVPPRRPATEPRCALPASRPDLLAQHIEMLRGVRDADAFRRAVDAALVEQAPTR